jgi:glutathione S-transferase
VTLTLYSRYQNSAGERVRIVMNLKGLDYEYVPVASLAAGEYRRLNPQGLMPALAVEGVVAGQSMAIVEYLEERWPEPLAPSRRAAAPSTPSPAPCRRRSRIFRDRRAATRATKIASSRGAAGAVAIQS